MQFAASEKRYQQACKVLALGVSSGFRSGIRPIQYFDHGDGPYLFDVDGNEFVDYTLAWGPLILGSNHRGINEAVTRQLSRNYTVGAQHDLEIELATKMVQSVPGVEMVIFSNTGSEAVQAAFRLARARTGRDKILKFEGHYHGWMNNALVSYHPSPDALGTLTPGCGGQPASEYSDVIVLPWNDIDALRRAFSDYPGQIACVITEALLVNSGSCMPHDGYLDQLVALCTENGAVSIFDEVITGFRIALGGAREYFGVEPDLSVYAKALAGGFSLAAVGGRRDSFEALLDGRTGHFGTYNGSAPNLAAALATLDALSESGTYDRMNAHGYAIREHIEVEGRRLKLPLVTTGAGTAFSVHFGLQELPRNYADTLNANSARSAEFRDGMLHQGILCLPEGRWYVGATHTDTELAKVNAAITHVMQTL
jgi:glutamate-1-semialdehyde 2,1-aminomutase